jgi:nitrous oxidase accessory protein
MRPLLPAAIAALSLLALPATSPAGQGDEVPAGTLEGAPAPADRSPLQRLIDAAAPGATVTVPPGRYVGDLLVDRPLTLRGLGRPLLVGAGNGSVLRVRAADVVIDGFDIDGMAGGDLGRDSSGIHIAAPRAVVRNCRVVNSLFGVYLREANGSRIEGTTVDGIRDKTAGEKGSGIHVWNTDGFALTGNTVRYTRDGIYIQSSPNGVVRGNVAADLRYGLHYMYSDDNLFEDNRFENGAAGTAIMYSRRMIFRRNAFLRNRGFASVGLLFKTCDDVVAEDNLLGDNARGVFLEGSARVTLRRNVIAQSDVALVIYDSTRDVRVEGNSFVANLSPLSLVGRRTDTVFAGNYWSDHRVPDLDGDGRSDLPYRLSSLFDHFRGNLTAADLFSDSLAASALAAAERSFPVLELIPVTDDRPLASPPALPDVPRGDTHRREGNPIALAGTFLLTLLGTGAWWRT